MSEAAKILEILQKGKEDPPFYAAVIVVSQDQQNFLIGKRREDGIHTSPAGGAKVGETPKEAAIREAFEEANLKLTPGMLRELPVWHCKNGKVCHRFMAVLKDEQDIRGHNDPDKEVYRWKWHPIDQRLPEPICDARHDSFTEARMKLCGLKKSDVETTLDLLKGKKSPVGTISPNGKFIKVGEGDWRSADKKHHQVSLDFSVGGKRRSHNFVEHGNTPEHVWEKVQGKIKNLENKAGRVELHGRSISHIKPLKKSLVESELSGVNIDVTNNAIEEMSTANNPWYGILKEALADFSLGDPPRSILLEYPYMLNAMQVDDGIYDGYVKIMNPNSGDYGQILSQFKKLTLSGLLQALKAKGFVSVPEKQPEPPAEKPQSRVDDIVGLIDILRDFRGGDININFYKGWKAFPIGTVRVWGGQKYVKHADGWVAVGGEHHGKLMGKFKEAPTHKEHADSTSGEDKPKRRGGRQAAPVGDKRTWTGQDYVKHGDGWVAIGGQHHGKLMGRFKEDATHKDFADQHSGEKKPEPPKTEPKVEQPVDKPEQPKEAESKPSESETKKEDPREAAQAEMDRLEAEGEYANARASSISNMGEDLLDSARHKAMEWKGYAAAEADGTADKLIQRDKLLKQMPVDFISDLGPENAVAPLVSYLALKGFPAKPPGMKRFYGRDAGRDGDKSFEKQIRKDYFEAFELVRNTTEKLSKSGGTSHENVLKEIRDVVGARIRELQKRPDKPFEVANMLVSYHNNTLSASSYRNKTSVGAKYHIYRTLIGAKHGFENKNTWSETDEFRTSVLGAMKADQEPAKSIMEGQTLEAAFGVGGKSKKKTISRADMYVNSANRNGPELQQKTLAEQGEYLMKDCEFRGLQWGNSVTDDERKHHLKKVAESMKDLSDVLGLPLKMTSFNGRLGLAIGARGKGSALAHYEPDSKVINLTRKNGSGSLAHEWGHMFDNVLAGVTPEIKGKAGYVSSSWWAARDAVKEGTPQKAIHNLMQSDAWSKFKDSVRDKTRELRMTEKRAGYWRSDIEMFARAFETYVDHKLQKMGRKNEYLAGLDSTKTGGLYPSKDLMEQMAPMFDTVFSSFKKSEYLTKAFMELIGQLSGSEVK